MSTKETNRQRFERSYSYRALFDKYTLQETGTWEIYGEDPNCNLGGSHITPRLGTAEGKLTDVIDYAVELSGFFQWGYGGNIKKVEGVVKVSPAANAERARLKKQEQELERQLADIKAQLGE